MSQEEAAEEVGEDARCEVCSSGGEEGEEGRTAVGLTSPQKVSKKEREEHEKTHTPFRAWCKYCVKGRGQNTAHRRQEDESPNAQVPRISMDHFFMSKPMRRRMKTQ